MGTSAGAPQAAPPLPDDRLPRQVTSLKRVVWKDTEVRSARTRDAQRRWTQLFLRKFKGCPEAIAARKGDVGTAAPAVRRAQLDFFPRPISDLLLAGPQDRELAPDIAALSCSYRP
jgi:hypothetical protein